MIPDIHIDIYLLYASGTIYELDNIILHITHKKPIAFMYLYSHPKTIFTNSEVKMLQYIGAYNILNLLIVR